MDESDTLRSSVHDHGEDRHLSSIRELDTKIPTSHFPLKNDGKITNHHLSARKNNTDARALLRYQTHKYHLPHTLLWRQQASAPSSPSPLILKYTT